jgi:hypothetical protein
MIATRRLSATATTPTTEARTREQETTRGGTYERARTDHTFAVKRGIGDKVLQHGEQSLKVVRERRAARVTSHLLVCVVVCVCV